VQAVILAAGRGTRLAPITNSRSKGMLPILGKPILERILDGLIAYGLKDFILVVSPEDYDIKEYFVKISSADIKIRFVEQFQRMGTADALKLAARHITGDFVLSACDSLVPAGEIGKLISTWSGHSNIQGLLSLERIPLQDTVKTGIVTMDGDLVTGIIEKPAPEEAPSNISSTPLYVFSARILEYLSRVPLSTRGEYELQNAVQMMIDDGHTVRGLFLRDRLTLTYAGDLLAINMHFLEKQGEINQVFTQNIGSSTDLIEPLYIEAGVNIGSKCEIGPGVYIESGAFIGNNVKLQKVVVLRGTFVPAGDEIKNLLVVSK
jgi:NDP-sugar pyrophosphorylase family protein